MTPYAKFFEHPYDEQPDVFKYANAATFMCSAIVQQVTGQTVLDIITENFFLPMGIKGCRWLNLGGISEGYSGLFASAADIANFMQLYLHDGVYGSKRLLSHEWVKMATDCQIITGPDYLHNWWIQGYGYQFWRNPNGFARAEGALGQKGYIFPELNVTAAHEGIFGDEDPSNDAIYDFCANCIGESTVSVGEIESFLADWYMPIEAKAEPSPVFGNTYIPECGDVKAVTFIQCEDCVECMFTDMYQQQTLKLGFGEWQINRYWGMNPACCRIIGGEPIFDLTEFAACCAVEPDGALTVNVRFLNQPHNVTLRIAEEDGALVMRVDGTDREYRARRL